MWTSTLELSLRRVILTQFLGRFWHGAYFSSFAPLQVQNLPRQQLLAPNWVRVRNHLAGVSASDLHLIYVDEDFRIAPAALDRKSTRLNSSHDQISYAVFCLKKKIEAAQSPTASGTPEFTRRRSVSMV